MPERGPEQSGSQPIRETVRQLAAASGTWPERHWARWPAHDRPERGLSRRPELIRRSVAGALARIHTEYGGRFQDLRDLPHPSEDERIERTEIANEVASQCIKLLHLDPDEEALIEELASFQLTPNQLIREQFRFLEAELSVDLSPSQDRVAPSTESVVAKRLVPLRDFLDLCHRDILERGRSSEIDVGVLTDKFKGVRTECHRLLGSCQTMIGQWLCGLDDDESVVQEWEQFRDSVMTNLRAAVQALQEVGCTDIEAATVLHLISAIPSSRVSVPRPVEPAVDLVPLPDGAIPLQLDQFVSVSETTRTDNPDDLILLTALRQVFGSKGVKWTDGQSQVESNEMTEDGTQ